MAMYKKTASQLAREELNKTREYGLELLKVFHEWNKKNTSYKLTFDQLVSILESRPNQKNFLSTLGSSVVNSGTPKSAAIASMQSLGLRSRGKIPEANSYFIDAIVRKATEFKFVDAVVFTAKESAGDIVSGLQTVGNTAMATGKVLAFITPFMPFIILFIVFKLVTNKQLVGNLSKLIK